MSKGDIEPGDEFTYEELMTGMLSARQEEVSAAYSLLLSLIGTDYDIVMRVMRNHFEHRELRLNVEQGVPKDLANKLLGRSEGYE